MKDNFRGILLLMKSAVTRQPETLPEGFDLESQMELLKPHHMYPLIYDGAARCGIARTEPVMQQLFQIYYKALLRSEGQQRAIRRIREEFSAAGFDFMLLKGSRMKHLYPAPELRYMGDADILIRTEQYDRIRPILEKLGYSYKLESDHELVWKSDALYLELHKRLIPSYNEDLYAYYGDGWKLAHPLEGSEYGMKPEDEWIYLFTHYAKHYRDGGVGCRYVADLWVWRRSHPDMDEGYIRPVMETMHLADFYGNTLRLLDYWFGEGPGDQILDVMTEFIFASGSWGAKESQRLSQAVRHAKHSALGFNGRLLYLWRLAFPKAENLREKYRILYKAPWLLPVVWLVRPFYKILFETRTLKTNAEHMQTLSQENIRLKREMLRLVGLDFHS